MKIDGIEVFVEGAGAEAIVMIHGWPDTHRLWDTQVAELKHAYRCVRFTLPGFDSTQPARAYGLHEVLGIIRRIVEQTCPGETVTLLVHDWGCLYGYQFATRHPELVKRVIGVDIGDAGSRRNRADLGFKGKFAVLAYQMWLATAWKIGGNLGDRMARWMARMLRCPVDPAAISAQMGYPYAVQWFGVEGGFGRLRVFQPNVPMLYIYGQRKPFMFHSQSWIDKLVLRPGNRVLALPTGHWVMVGRPGEFNEAVLEWLTATDEHRNENTDKAAA
jgi:pimeloyl-ACP methyl ester carboxylesterase